MKLWHRVQSIVTVLFIAAGLCSCTSLQDRAEKSYKEGAYIAAASLYEQVLDKDPNDGVARERLKLSRQQIIENRLIEVRQQRLSDDYEGAIKKLEAIISDENKWSVSPMGAAFSTQLEEMDLLFGWVEQQVKTEINAKKMLRAKLQLDKYRQIFSIGTTRKKQDILMTAITQLGLEHCAKLKKVGEGYYSQEFIKRYCMVWGDEEFQNSNRKPSSNQDTVKEAYGSIVIAGTISDLPVEALSGLSEPLLDGLKATPFYFANAGPLKVKVTGKFLNNYSERATLKVHSYQVKIPYQVPVSVSYFVSVPYTAYEQETNYSTGRTYSVPVTKYTYETRYRTDLVTRYKSVSRSLTYPAVDFKLNYSIIGKAAFTIDGSKHEISLNKQLVLTDYYSETQNADIGLWAKRKNVVPPLDWLKDSFGSFDKELSMKVETAWDSKYCKVPSNMLAKTQIESVMKCLKGSNHHHDFVENWFQSNFGMSYEDVSNAIGLGA